MNRQQIEQVRCMLFLHCKNGFEHRARCGIIVGEVADQFAIVIYGDAFRDQIFADHTDQIRACDVLRRRAASETFRIEIGITAELIDALGDSEGMLHLLARVLREFLRNAFTGQARGHDRMLSVAQDADEFSCENRL